MGLGGIKNTENQLTDAQNQFGMQAGQQKYAMAQQQAQAYFDQANMAVKQSAEEALLMQRQVDIAAGNQMEQYGSAGVEQQGSALSVVNSTRAIGAIQVQAIQERGALQAKLLRTQGFLSQEGGMQDLMSAEGQTVINKMQNKLTQQEQQYQENMGLLGMGVSFGTSLLGGL